MAKNLGPVAPNKDEIMRRFFGTSDGTEDLAHPTKADSNKPPLERQMDDSQFPGPGGSTAFWNRSR